MHTLGHQMWQELEMEATATRKCLQNIPASTYGYKPHEKSLNMGYIALIVAEIPKWISTMVHDDEIDFVTFKHFEAKSAEEMVKHFDENLAGAKEALMSISDEDMEKPFSLKAAGHLIMTTPKKANIGPSINHMVHHRGQLTVYMRLNDLPVPSIYGPSADDKGF